jgi:hypothetical protein
MKMSEEELVKTVAIEIARLQLHKDVDPEKFWESWKPDAIEVIALIRSIFDGTYLKPEKKEEEKK